MEYVPLKDLRRWPRNPKRHDTASLDASVKRFGFRDPIEVDERTGRIVSGHGRLEDLERRVAAGEPPPDYVDIDGADWLVPVVRGGSFETDREAEAYLLAANRLTETGGWDDGMLAAALRDQESLVGLGWTDREAAGLLARSVVTAEDGPAQEVEPRTKTGELWALGRHRLLCGDATSAIDVARLLGDVHPGLMVTDPPYGVEYDPQWRDDAAKEGLIAYAARRVGVVTNDDRADWREAWVLSRADVAYAWAPAGPTFVQHHLALAASGFEVRMTIIWSKRHIPISRGHYHVRHEPCLYAVRKGATASWVGGRDQTTIWDATLDGNVPGGHSTQKPVELMARPMRNHDYPDVYDPFLGSGTTLIAAEQLGRRCFAMEISPAYCDVAIARWERLTGQTAELLP